MIICKKCAYVNPDDVRSCQSCGAVLEADNALPLSRMGQEPSSAGAAADGSFFTGKTGKRLLLTVLILIAAAAAVLVFALHSGSGTPTELPADTEELWYSNVVNGSSVAMDAQAVYFPVHNQDTGSWEIVKQTDSGRTAVVEENSYISCLNISGEQLYYITASGGKNCICRVSTDGGEREVYIRNHRPSELYVFGDNLYYTVQNYNGSNDCAVFGKNIRTGELRSYGTLKDTSVYQLLEYQDRVYLRCYDLKSSEIRLRVSRGGGGFEEMMPDGYEKYHVSAMTAANGRLYLSLYENDRCSIISLQPDGSDPKQIAEDGGSEMVVYGKSLYYISKGSNSLSRVDITGGSPVQLRAAEDMCGIGICRGRLYYHSYDGSYYNAVL